jgi:hypothetical protein
MKKRNFINVLVVCGLVMYLFANCSETNETGNGDHGTPYDPSKPLTVKSISPESGGFATKVIIDGSNFGNNPADVRVWFNNKQAAVIGTNGDHLYAIAPRTPGDTCTISVAVGNDSTSIDHPFIYRISTTVVTIAGQQGVNTFKAGTLAEATFSSPRYLTVDSEGNVFIADWGTSRRMVLLNEEKDVVMQLPGTTLYYGGQPTFDVTEKILLIPDNDGNVLYTYDRDLQWAFRRKVISHPSAEEIAEGKKNFSTIMWKQSFASCEVDGMIYTHDWGGNLVKFDPVTLKGEHVRTTLDFSPNNMASMIFHPVNKEELYLMFQMSALYSYNIITGEIKHITGTMGVTGYRDGPFEDALFYQPEQFVFDENGDIIVADGNNHCIRKLNMKDRIVSTVVGKGGQKGYRDGNPDDALFNTCWGVCIDKDYTIYIADFNNNCIRKLVIQ